MKLKEICERLDGDLSGDGDIEITGVSGINEALPSQITFVANPKYLAAIATTQAGGEEKISSGVLKAIMKSQ